jgi:glutamate:GABA antiporter
MATITSAPAKRGAMAQEKSKLRKVLGRFDLVFFTASAIVGLDTVAFAASVGGQAVLWLGISLLLFLIPYGMLVAELGSTFPVEGGPYAWTRMALGRLPGSIAAVLYWLSNPIWVGGTLAATAIATLDAFVFTKHPLGTAAEILVGLAFVWVCVGLAIIALRIGKWGPNMGTIVKILAVGIFTVLFIAFLVQHGRPVGTVHAGDLKPSVTGFLGVVGVLIFLWVGFELSSGAGEEMRNPKRDVPVMVLQSGAIGAVLYGLVLLGIMLVIPKAALSNVSGFADAYNRVAGVLGGASRGFGYFFAAVIILTLIGSGSVWLEGADRAQAIAALDGAAPKWMGRFTSFGTPIAVNLMSGIIGSAFVFFVFLITKGSLSHFFAVMIALVISLATLCYFFMFPALIVLRRKYPDRPRPYTVPGGMVGAWIAVILCEIFVVLAGVTLLWPGLIDRILGHSYSIQDNFGVSRLFFEAVTLGTFGAIIVLAVVFWLVGRHDIKVGALTDTDLLEVPLDEVEQEGAAPTLAERPGEAA